MKKLFLFLLTVAAIPSFAQDAADEKSGSDADLYVNVTAARELKATESIPAAVTVISREDMEGHSVTEALSIYAGVGFSSTANADTTANPVIRGFSENSQGRVLVMIDGVKLNNPDMSAVNWLSIPEERIERIEVIKGGNSALYGDNAVAAVINVITETPDGKTSVTADLSGGSFDSWSRSVSASAGGEKLSLSVNAEDEKSDGWRERTGYESTDFSGRVNYKPAEKLDMSLSLIYSDSYYEMPGSITQNKYDEDPEQADNKSDFADNYFTQVNTENEYELSDNLKILLGLSYSNKQNYADMVSWLKYTTVKINTCSANPSVIVDVPGLFWGSSVNTGIDYCYQIADSKRFTDATRTEINTDDSADTEIKRNTIGFYARGESYILENLVLSLSARIETSKTEAEFANNSSLDDDNNHIPFVYGAGLSYIFAENSKAYFSYNRLFRYPFIDEQINYAGSWDDGFINDLDPEKGDSFEIGIDYNAFKYIKGGINLFLLLMEDEIAADDAAEKNVNLDKTVHYGTEINMTVMPVEVFSTRFNYNYTVAEYREGDYKDKSLTMVPEHVFSIIPEVKLFNFLKAYAEFSYTDEMYMSGDNTNEKRKNESFFLTNIGVSMNKEYEGSDIKIYLDVKNLFDTEYSTYSLYYAAMPAWSIPESFNYYPGSGREITVGTKVSF